MNIEDINHPELKNHINMIYMHGENKNQDAIEKQYYSLNVMDENKDYIIEKLDYFKKLKEDPNFLGYIVNIARVSYIINITLI